MRAIYHAHYVDQYITSELDFIAFNALHKLRCFGGRSEKRVYCSMKECVQDHVLSETKLLLVAPDIMHSNSCATCPMKLLGKLLAASMQHDVPFVFCLSRRGLGDVFGRCKRISTVAIVDVRGCEREIAELMAVALQCRLYYHARLTEC